MRRVFQSDAMEKEFTEKGFLKIPFLTDEELIWARDLFEEVDPKVETNFYSSIDSRDKPYRMEVDRRLREKFLEKTEAYFVEYYPIAYTFIVKRPGEDTLIRMHVDDIHVDQGKYASVNLWCPLVNTNEQNGAMEVIEGSHRLPNPQRGLGLPFPWSKYEHLFGPYIRKVPMKAGEAILYHDKLIHGSPPNRSDKVRPALITGLIPKEAQPIIYFRHPELKQDECECFEVSGDFWFEFDKHKKPEGMRSLGIEKYHPADLSDAEFLSYLKTNAETQSHPPRKTFFQKLLGR